MKSIVIVSLIVLNLFSSNLKTYWISKEVDCDGRYKILDEFQHKINLCNNPPTIYDYRNNSFVKDPQYLNMGIPFIKFENKSSQTIYVFNGISTIPLYPNHSYNNYNYDTLKEIMRDCNSYKIKQKYFVFDYGDIKEENANDTIEIYDKVEKPKPKEQKKKTFDILEYGDKRGWNNLNENHICQSYDSYLVNNTDMFGNTMCAYIGKYQKANEELRKFIQYKKAKQQRTQQ